MAKTYRVTHQGVLHDAYGDIVGIDRDGHVFGGASNGLPDANPKTEGRSDVKGNVTYMPAEEKRKLADIMIERWKSYREMAE